MVCKLPSARSLSKARSEGALRENMANADMSASVKEMSPSSQRESGMVAKPLRTKRKSASAERCLRALGATMDRGNPLTRTSHRSSQEVFSHQCLRKASSADPVITGLEGSAGIAVHFMPFTNYTSHTPKSIIPLPRVSKEQKKEPIGVKTYRLQSLAFKGRLLPHTSSRRQEWRIPGRKASPTEKPTISSG